ncbi:YXWGXW repeat-containing protein [Bordetella sp. LUAb4]|uniref:YXWGXW repeat-containing protein n=1 Tax=Bordetella sp. LUAb4 TaxID=2843195 RepID=UPI001E4FF51C|nr:YXWGXW repeat-containing protein [Bordetella sp. LUAb4]
MKTIAKIATSAGVALIVSLGAMTVPAVAHADVSINIGVAPPPPRVEVVPAPRAGYIWAPGHWEWRRDHHVWIGGSWLRARPGYAYRAPQWRQDHGRWVYAASRWDRDGDGVPDRHDRRPDNPHRH